MEGYKTAMYSQAGKSHGWIGIGNDSPIPDAPAPATAPAPIQAPLDVSQPVEAFTPPILVLPTEKSPVQFPAASDDCQTLVMAYVANQCWKGLYEPDQGFTRGTLFKELDLPFVGEGACKHE